MLNDLRARLEQRAADAEAIHATAPVAMIYRQLLGELETVSPNGNGVGRPASDRLLTVAEVAPRLGVTPRWLYVHADRLPFSRRLPGRALRFSEAGLIQYLERQR